MRALALALVLLASCSGSSSGSVSASSPSAAASALPAAMPAGDTTSPGPTAAAANSASVPRARGASADSSASAAPLDPRETYRIEQALLSRLHEAGDRERCRKEMARIRGELAGDARLTVEDLERMRDSRDIKPDPGDGPMPYPTPGTACAIFGSVRVFEGAINDRLRASGAAPKYPEDGRPLVVGGE